MRRSVGRGGRCCSRSARQRLSVAQRHLATQRVYQVGDQPHQLAGGDGGIGIEGVITGRALYDGRLDLAEAIGVAKG